MVDRPNPSPFPSLRVVVLRPPPPIRSLAIAAVSVTIGAMLLVVAVDRAWAVALAIVGGMAMLLGLGLAAAALVVQARLTTRLVLDAAGYRIHRGRTAVAGRWADVTQVRTEPYGLALVGRGGEEYRVALPRGRDRTWLRLVEQLRARLDADRGYHSPESEVAEPHPSQVDEP